jgi:hypothetical protein
MRLFSSALFGALLVVASAGAGSAQTAPPGYLVQQDLSDCQNSNVHEGNPSNMGGAVLVNRGADGKTSVKIAVTASRNTTYHFFLKCVRLLGDITTDDEGIADVVLSFTTNEVGNVFAFDMYPEGAPAGNKFQSTQIKF